MAGIEKMCEYSGVYVGWDMYGYKRNHLQIIPKYRKLFRNDGDTLYVQHDGKYWEFPFGGYTRYTNYEMKYFEPPFTDEKEYINYMLQHRYKRIVDHYAFAYVTNTNELLGDVDGVYINWTYNLSKVKRKIKRMLRCRKLNVVFVDNIHDYTKSLKVKTS